MERCGNVCFNFCRPVGRGLFQSTAVVHLKHLTWFQNLYPCRSQQQLMHFYVKIPIRNSRFLSRNNKFFIPNATTFNTKTKINAYKYEINDSFHVLKLSKLLSNVMFYIENIVVSYDKIYCSLGSISTSNVY